MCRRQGGGQGVRFRVHSGWRLLRGARRLRVLIVEDDVLVADSSGPDTVRFLRRAAPSVPVIVRTVAGGAVVISGIVIGEHAYVEPGTVVNRNVPDHAIILGWSAHRVGWVCRCGQRLPDTLHCAACGQGYRLGRSGLRELPG